MQDKVEPIGQPKEDTTRPMGTMGTPRDAKAEAKAKGLTIAEERVYLNSKGEKVGEDDPDKQTLLAAKGQPVPNDETIKAMGFKTQAQRDGTAEEGKPADPAAENAKRAEAAGRKARGQGEDKSRKAGGDK